MITFLFQWCAKYLPVTWTLFSSVKLLVMHKLNSSIFNAISKCWSQQQGLTIRLQRVTNEFTIACDVLEFHRTPWPITQKDSMRSWLWRFNFIAYDIQLGPCLPYYLETPLNYFHIHIYSKKLLYQKISMFFKQHLVLFVLLLSYHCYIVCSFCIVFFSSFMVMLIHDFYLYFLVTLEQRYSNWALQYFGQDNSFFVFEDNHVHC